MSEPVVNIAAYLFVDLPDCADLRPGFLEICQAQALRGTVLLTPEGINLFLAGSRSAITDFLTWLRQDPRFAPLQVKESLSATQPFRRLLIKVRAEIITMRQPMIRPIASRAPAVSPADLKRWLDQGHDDGGRPVLLLDTRNTCEITHGTFRGATHFDLTKFTDFPQAVTDHRDALNDKTVVTFCTGGIRCEKAAILMEKLGFTQVYQLDGGILGYFESQGGAHYDGACFVFDERQAVDPLLAPVTPV